MTLGFTDGTTLTGSLIGGSGYINLDTGRYGKNIGLSYSGSSLSSNKTVGITADPTKSGLIAKFSGLTLGTVPSEKLGSFYIRY